MAEQTNTGALPQAEAVELEDAISYVDGSTVSRVIAKNAAGTVTLFAFDAGQDLSEHQAPFDAIVQVLEGNVKLTIGGKPLKATAGQMVVMPANVPHALLAETKMKMMLIMLRA